VSENLFGKNVHAADAALRRSKLIEASMLHPDETQRATMVIILRANKSVPVQAVQYLRLANLDLEDVRYDQQRATIAQSLQSVQQAPTLMSGALIDSSCLLPAMVLMTSELAQVREGNKRCKRNHAKESTSCTFGVRTDTSTFERMRSVHRKDLILTATHVEKARGSRRTDGGFVGGLGEDYSDVDVMDFKSDHDTSDDTLREFSTSDLTGKQLISYQNEIRTLRLYLRILASTEGAIIAAIHNLVRSQEIPGDREQWSATERDIMRVHEATVRTIRFQAEETERAWVRLLYKRSMFWEPVRVPDTTSQIPWRTGLLRSSEQG
jgi:hypothetical protein